MITPPHRLKLGQLNTPLQPLDRLSELYNGPRIWIKRDDMTGCATSGNKVRKLEFLLAEAIRQGCDSVITCGGVQSNHCRATAILGAQMGLQVKLLLRADEPAVSDGNLFLGELTGADISHYSAVEFRHLQQHVDRWLEQQTQAQRKPYYIPIGGSNGLGLWGYIEAAAELARDFAQHAIKPGAILHATGSGGTQAGLIVGCKLHAIDAPVIGFAVCDDAAYFAEKIAADFTEWQRLSGAQMTIESSSICTIDRYIGPRYGRCDPEVFELIGKLAKLEGIILDPVYSAKAFYGMLQELQRGRFDGVSDIVFIHTGGLFGLFAQRDQLLL